MPKRVKVKPVQENIMCCSLFWTVCFSHLAVFLCKLMGVQSIWLFPPCKPSTYLHGSFTQQGEKGTKNWKKKIPQAVTSDHTTLCYYFENRNVDVQTGSPCSVRLPAANSSNCLSSSLYKEWARKRMTSEEEKWVALHRFCLKVTLQFSLIQKCFYYSSFNLLFLFFFPLSYETLWFSCSQCEYWKIIICRIHVTDCSLLLLPAPSLSAAVALHRVWPLPALRMYWFPFSDLLCLFLQLFVSQRGHCLRSRSNPPLNTLLLYSPSFHLQRSHSCCVFCAHPGRYQERER